jgi:hypothetical protein
MQTVLKVISFIGLGFTIVPSILVLSGDIGMDLNKSLMMAGTILWFGTVIFWMNKNKMQNQE